MNSSRKFWEKIYQENTPKLIGICRRYVQNNQLAEDLVHDAFLTAIDKQSTYSGKGSFEGWLRQIVINTALMHLRKEKNHIEKRNLSDMEEKIQYDDEPEEQSIIEEAEFTDEELLAAIDELPLHHKLVFNLYVIDNYSHKQIAEKLNISEGTSKSHLARARKAIQKILLQKASLQKKEKTKTAILVPVTAKANYIDILFRSRMANYSLTPAKDTGSFLSQINWNLQTKPPILKKPMMKVGIQISKFVLLPLGFVFLAMYSTSVYTSSKEKPVEKHIEQVQPKPVSEILPLKVNSTRSIADTSHFTIPKPTKKTPVIVKRTIVQKQTVKVQKRVQIYDTTNIR